MSDSKNLAALIEALRSGDHSRLSELLAALRTLPPEAAQSTLQQQGLQITGDGNIIGSGNVAIVVKDDVPALATQLTELARRVRAAELYGQAASLLERNQVREASTVLVELDTLDPHYRGVAELRDRARRAQVRQRFRTGMRVTIGLIAAMAISFGIWSSVRPRTCPGEMGISGQGILAIAPQNEDDHLRWWLGSAGEGLRLADRLGPVYHAPDLGAETVLALATDEQARRLWVGTLGGGLAVLSWNNGKESWRRYTVSDGLPGCQISAIHQSSERIYVGAYDGVGLGISDDGEHWRTFPPPNDWPADITFWVTSLASAADNTLWVGTSRGVYRFDGSGWSQRYQPAWFGSKLVKVSVVGVDQGGMLWVGTEDQGLALLVTRQGQETWIGPITAQQGLASDQVTAISFLPAENGALIGTANGLGVCVLQGAQTSPICAVIPDARVTMIKVMCLAIMPAGDVWVGSTAREPIRLPAAVWRAVLP
jgi:ligand-binding sensor domain-containing protein